jgi:hypothetical protein
MSRDSDQSAERRNPKGFDPKDAGAGRQASHNALRAPNLKPTPIHREGDG